ncbi:MAG: DNA-directed RNA polymerase subunit E [Methanomassiliicoccaceae archaeon]|nr:DNA-directed RNA polymerase subunit E [Methanomassiliicoccaceae archaeon]
MIGPVYRACKQCNFLSEMDACPRCGGQTSKEWQGFIAVVDFERSDIAKRMGITANGRYALKVR